MTDHQMRTIITKLHDLARFVAEASDSERETLLLQSGISTALLVALEFAEANRPDAIDAADWSSVRHFYVLAKRQES